MMVWYDIVFRLVIAIIVGACIGMERQWNLEWLGYGQMLSYHLVPV